MPRQSNMIPRGTLSIEFSPQRKCSLFARTETPIHITATLQHPLSGVCHAVRCRPWRKSRTAGISNTQRNVFAAELSTTPDGSCGGGSDGSEGQDHGSADGDGDDEVVLPATGFPRLVCIKYAAGVEAVAALRREELLYRRELAPLAGIAVPRTYGLFTGGTMAAPIACLLMDLCESTTTLKSADEFCRLAMLTLCKVHAAGVMHNTPLDLRHFVMKGKQIFLVDFSCAIVHPCGNAHPILYQDSYSPIRDDEHDPSECRELKESEHNIFWQIGERLQ